MKPLIATTALALVFATPAMAQTVDNGDQQIQEVAGDQGFLAALEQGDILVGELIGQDVYAPSVEEAADDAAETDDIDTDDTLADAVDGDSVEHRSVNADELDNMDNIGSVNEVIIDQDGQLKAIVVGVGGFLGLGDRNVALTPDNFDLAWDAEDSTQYYVIANTTAEELEAAPEFELEPAEEQDQAAVEDDEAAAPATDEWRGDRDAYIAPEVTREGYETADVSAISADDMIGSSVYDLNEENIGNVDDIVLGADGAAEYIVLDVGGFLGIGTHTVAIGLDEVSVLHDDGWDDVRIYVDATQEQLESMPEYDG